MSEFEVVIILTVLCVAIVSSTFADFGLDSGKGEQIGYISEIENNGIFWRPTAVTLIGSEATFSSSQTSWSYAADSPVIVESATRFLKNHKPVIVKYETSTFCWRWECSHRTKITGIEEYCGEPE